MTCVSHILSLAPDEFLRWWFERAEEHGLDQAYASLYANYFDRPDTIPYVWRHFARRMRGLENLDLKNKRFLDVGCGLGTEVMWAALRGADSVGLELHPQLLDIATRRLAILSGLVPVRCEIRRQNVLDLEGQFDVVFMREAFHHMEPRAKIVHKLAALLRPGGLLIIEETNGYNPLIQFKYLLTRGLRTVVTKRWPDGSSYLFGNERITTDTNLSCLFSPFGIKGQATYFRILPTKLARHSVLALMVEKIEGVLPDWAMFRPLYLHYSWSGIKRGEP